ncbi:hypothetical protein ERJ75_001294400 [Trypanosoma vivax]|nr:hypothetical protein ERJ75_001295000 [Trypanosoma vivax]KAH8608574.1 hypothetical protein ERJ75_001294400 [Trypanosoma vivax]
MSKSTGADHRQGQLCTQRHLPPNPTPRKRCSCCAPLEDTDAHHATRRRDTQSCRARAPPRACVRAFGRGKVKKRQREPELPVAVFVVCGCKSIALWPCASSTALGVSKKNVPDAAPNTCHAECCVLGCTHIFHKTAAMAARAVLREEQRTRFAAMRHVVSERR